MPPDPRIPDPPPTTLKCLDQRSPGVAPRLTRIKAHTRLACDRGGTDTAPLDEKLALPQLLHTAMRARSHLVTTRYIAHR